MDIPTRKKNITVRDILNENKNNKTRFHVFNNFIGITFKSFTELYTGGINLADVKKLNNMFLVNAPAGSGKTTYIENTIINLLAQYPNRRILSITYTNRAKEELNSRINSKNVTIDTIHSFLSDFVGLYFSKPEVIDLYLQVFEKKIKALIDNGEDDSKNARYIDKFGKLDLKLLKIIYIKFFTMSNPIVAIIMEGFLMMICYYFVARCLKSLRC